MTRRTSAWKLLGIAPTDDARAIKKAYAAKLKAIDPDRDPQAFIALREARDAALRGGHPSPPAWDPPEQDRRADRPVEELPGIRPDLEDCRPAEPRGEAQVALAEPPAPRQRTSPWQTPSLDDHMRAIEALLFAPAGEPVDAAELGRRGEALLRHPDMDVISRADEVEAWLAQAIVDSIPRSDALLGLAMRRFDWESKAENWECPWYIEAAVGRDRDCRFREHALESDLGPGMRQLAKPPPARTDFLMAWAVAHFLREIRDNYPTIERDFDPDTVAWWDRQLAMRRQRFPWVKALALAAALLGVSRLAGASDALTPALAALAGAFAWFAVKRRLQRDQQEATADDPAPLRRTEGAAIAALLLLPLCALVTPASPLALIGYAVAAGGLALLAGRAPPPEDEDPVDVAWQARIAILAPLLWLHAMLWAQGLSVQVLIPIAAAAWAGFAHGERVRDAVFDGRRDRLIRGTIVTAGMILWYRIFNAVSGPELGGALPLLLVLAVTLVLAHQIADPPERWQKEWSVASVIAILVAALGGPLLAMMLVVARTGRAVARLGGD